MNFWRIYILGILLSVVSPLSAQSVMENIELAHQYYEQGEFQKAVDAYKKAPADADVFFEIYDNYRNALIQLKDTKGEEALIQKAYLLSGKNPVYQFDLALFFQRIGEEKSAQKQFEKSLIALEKNAGDIYQITKNLQDQQQYDWAKAVYVKGKEIFKNPKLFNLEIAYISGLQGDFDGMSKAFIEHVLISPQEIYQIIQLLDKSVEDESKAEILETNLLQAIGRDKQAWPAVELLAWLYNKQEDYASALDQVKSLDLLKNEDGSKVIELGRLAFREKDFRTAQRAYQYILQKGTNHSYYTTAALELIQTQKELIFQKKKYEKEDLLQLKQSYQLLIEQNLHAYNTILAKIDLADLEARYLFQTDSAILLLQDVVVNRTTPRDLLVKAKLALGDYYIMNGEHWESTLLYTQVEKDYKGTPLGEEAKYRNARLAYFKGDFDWALTQLKVIKGNTFELISNDAIELAVFISDNYNQDYEEDKAAMKNFSQMDLLYFQNNLAEADKMADLMLKNYVGHPIEDDIYYMKSKISKKRQEFDITEKYLLKIYQEFPKSIMSDDALFQLAELYEHQLSDTKKAQDYYEKILLEYPDSIFTIEARKRYRLLRGDQL